MKAIEHIAFMEYKYMLNLEVSKDHNIKFMWLYDKQIKEEKR